MISDIAGLYILIIGVVIGLLIVLEGQAQVGPAPVRIRRDR